MIKIDPFAPAMLDGLPVRNRIFRSGCYEGYCRGGFVTPGLIEHHRRVAEGGVAVTTVAYGCVSPEGRTFGDQIVVGPDTREGLASLAEAVHAEGARVSIQLTHGGYFADPRVIGGTPLGASRVFNSFRFTSPRTMEEEDIRRVIGAFGDAAALVKEAGYDAVEIHAGHGYLLSQFLSPYTNRRNDAWGGSPEARRRLPVEVVKRVRETVGRGFPVLIKMNVSDGISGGLEIGEAEGAAAAFGDAGVSAIIPSCGFTSKTPFMMLRGNVPVREMAGNRPTRTERLLTRLFGRLMVGFYPYRPLFLHDEALRILKATSVPVIYIGGAASLVDLTTLMDEGFSFVQMGRATIRDPDFPKKLAAGEIFQSDCDACNRCVAAMDGGGVVCVTAVEEASNGPE